MPMPYPRVRECGVQLAIFASCAPAFPRGKITPRLCGVECFLINNFPFSILPFDSSGIDALLQSFDPVFWMSTSAVPGLLMAHIGKFLCSFHQPFTHV